MTILQIFEEASLRRWRAIGHDEENAKQITAEAVVAYKLMSPNGPTFYNQEVPPEQTETAIQSVMQQMARMNTSPEFRNTVENKLADIYRGN